MTITRRSAAVFILTIVALALPGLIVAWDSYPPEGWTTDITEAVARAGREDRRILINFTGSDWCTWCRKLEGEVFAEQAFIDYADEELVLVFLDFPNSISQSEEATYRAQYPVFETIYDELTGSQGAAAGVRVSGVTQSDLPARRSPRKASPTPSGTSSHRQCSSCQALSSRRAASVPADRSIPAWPRSRSK